MKRNLSFDKLVDRLGRRDFLRLLCGSAGAALLRPVWRLQVEDQVLPVPPTLMLHTKDRWKLESIVKWLADNNYHSVTYHTFAQALRGDITLPDRPVILTIDDVGTDYIQPYFLPMLDIAEKAGYRGMLGVVTRATPSEHKENWSVLREFAMRDWQLDTHTTHHWVLPIIKDEKILRAEIMDSARMIEDGIGKPASSLILPYADVKLPSGKMDQRIFDIAKEAGLEFVVGMAQGRYVTEDSDPPYYLGRVGVGVDAVQTAWWLTHFNVDKP